MNGFLMRMRSRSSGMNLFTSKVSHAVTTSLIKRSAKRQADQNACRFADFKQ